MSGYDIVGDIHAHGEGLLALLKKMGYQGFKHPDGRKIIFMGDFIDRGTQHELVLDTVRRLISDGTATAIMGNHEFNAISYARQVRGKYIRPHTAQNTGQQAQFLAEYPFESPKYTEIIKWFETLPVFIELPDIAAVHACWNASSLKACKPFLTKRNTLRKSAYKEYARGAKSSFYNGINAILKGPELRLPNGLTYPDVSGVLRSKTRILWWEPLDAPPDAPANHLVEKGHFFPQFEGRDHERVRSIRKKFENASKKPVFIGHYNIPGAPYLTAENVACVNFKPHLVAYRWDHGDKELSPSKFVYL